MDKICDYNNGGGMIEYRNKLFEEEFLQQPIEI